MQRFAVIIKHPLRDNDWRVDIVQTTDDKSPEDIKRAVYSEMLGPFEVISITKKVDMGRDLSRAFERMRADSEQHSA